MDKCEEINDCMYTRTQLAESFVRYLLETTKPECQLMQTLPETVQQGLNH